MSGRNTHVNADAMPAAPLPPRRLESRFESEQPKPPKLEAERRLEAAVRSEKRDKREKVPCPPTSE